MALLKVLAHYVCDDHKTIYNKGINHYVRDLWILEGGLIQYRYAVYADDSLDNSHYTTIDYKSFISRFNYDIKPHVEAAIASSFLIR